MSSSTTQLTLVNNALQLLGHPRVTGLSSNTSRAQTVILDIYDQARLSFLEDYDWKNASKQISLPNTVGVTAASWSTTATIVFDNSVVNYAQGDDITIAGVTPAGYNGNYEVLTASATEVTYALSDPGPGTAFGFVSLSAPNHGFSGRVHLPVGFIRLTNVFESLSAFEEGDYQLFGRDMLTNVEILRLDYVYDSTDYSQWDNLMIDAFAANLAMRLAQPLLRSTERYSQMKQMYDSMISKSKFKNAGEPPYTTIKRRSAWLSARQGASSGHRGFTTPGELL